ncbi:MAG: hypothetical protein AABZ53_00755 [Planctomycetota bacterium]
MAHGRKRLIVGRGVIGVSLVVTLVMLVSGRYWFKTDWRSGWRLRVQSGFVLLRVESWPDFHLPPDGGLNRILPPELVWSIPTSWREKDGVVDSCLLGVVRRLDSFGARSTTVTFMLWPIALAGFATGGGLIWWGARVRRMGRRGCCPGCGYEMTGLAGGAACPECGKGKSEVDQV